MKKLEHYRQLEKGVVVKTKNISPPPSPTVLFFDDPLIIYLKGI